MAQEAREMSQLVEHLFRHEAAKLVATLTRIFGLEHLSLAEDVVQEALARALQIWPYRGGPQNPAAWLTQTAKNLATDLIRREQRFREKQSEIIASLEQSEATPISGKFKDEIADDRLRMMFVCCHPLIPPDAQIALALRTLCGFGVAEISHAFLTSEAAIAKRLTRAKQKIREARIRFEIPGAEELAERFDGVLHTLYLLFNEGYKASAGDKLVREELCREGIRLATLLVQHPAGNRPETHALLALMLLNSARLSTRADAAGNLLRLEEQDRKQWDQAMIARGMFHFAQSGVGQEISLYHLQAGIAACHCIAANYESTDWRQILSLYDRLLELDDSPIIALNRAIAVANVHGPAAGLETMAAIREVGKLNSYYLLYAVLGELEMRLSHREAAAEQFRKSLHLVETNSERSFLARRLESCAAGEFA